MGSIHRYDKYRASCNITCSSATGVSGAHLHTQELARSSTAGSTAFRTACPSNRCAVCHTAACRTGADLQPREHSARMHAVASCQILSQTLSTSLTASHHRTITNSPVSTCPAMSPALGPGHSLQPPVVQPVPPAPAQACAPPATAQTAPPAAAAAAGHATPVPLTPPAQPSAAAPWLAAGCLLGGRLSLAGLRRLEMWTRGVI